jgi:hypothetical protein
VAFRPVSALAPAETVRVRLPKEVDLDDTLDGYQRMLADLAGRGAFSVHRPPEPYFSAGEQDPLYSWRTVFLRL